MSEKDTYVFDEQQTKLEQIEWDDLWFQEATDTLSKRVLLIGDSITRACRAMINKRLNPLGVVVDQLATSKGNDNPFFIPLIDYAIAQQPSCCVLQLWLGHHGGHQSVEAFGRDYEKIIRHLLEKYPEKKLLIVCQTPVRERDHVALISERNERSIARGAVAKRIAEKYDLAYLDAYTPLIDKPELYTQDGIHLLEDGCQLLADLCAEAIQKLL